MKVDLVAETPENGLLEIEFNNGAVSKYTKYLQRNEGNHHTTIILGHTKYSNGEQKNILCVNTGNGIIATGDIVRLQKRTGTKVFFSIFEGLNTEPFPEGVGKVWSKE